MTWDEPTAEKCPECGATLLKKSGSLHCSREGCGFTRAAAKKGRSSAAKEDKE